MAKKSSGTTYVSQGVHSNVKQSTLNGIKSERNPAEKIINVQTAWLKGQNPWVTIANPNKEQTDRKFIRVKANILWGNPKERDKKMYAMAGA
jgi:hypothetical protein